DNQGLRLRILQLISEELAFEKDVQGHHRRAGLGAGEEELEHLDAVRGDDRDAVAGRDAYLGEPGRDPVGPLVDVRVREERVLASEVSLVRMHPRALAQELGDDAGFGRAVGARRGLAHDFTAKSCHSPGTPFNAWLPRST